MAASAMWVEPEVSEASDDARSRAHRVGATVALLIALAIALVAAVAATGLGAFVLMAAPGTALVGAWLAPALEAAPRRRVLTRGIAMGLATMLAADAAVTVVSIGAGLANSASEGAQGLVQVVVGIPFLFVVGAIVVGPFALAVTVPAGIAWAAVVRAALARAR
jgi:hypothetical protein